MILPVLAQPVAVYASAAPVTSAFQFVTVSLIDNPYADHDFVYTNTGTSPVVIVRLQPSCHCTSALIASDRNPDGEALPYTLAPGASVKIHAAINLGMDPSGPVSRTVSVYLKDQDEPVAIFTLSGTVEPDVVFSPAELHFGKISAGHSSEISVLVSVDNRIIPNGFPRLVSDDPNIVITPDNNSYYGTPKFAAKRPGSELDRYFKVTVPATMPLGRIDAAISLSGSTAALPSAVAQFEINTAIISGTVVGSVTADPEGLSFGTVLTGQSAVQTVRLIGKTPADVRGLTVKSGTPYIVPELSGGADTNGTVRTLTLTIKRTMPAGLFNANITVYLTNNERLTIHTTGYVTIRN